MVAPSRSVPRRCTGSDTRELFREERGRVLATLTGFLGDFDLAEEAGPDAFASVDHWPRDGGPLGLDARGAPRARRRLQPVAAVRYGRKKARSSSA